MEKYCISVDWLQCYCIQKEKGYIRNNLKFSTINGSFTVHSVEHQSAMFKQLFSVKREYIEVAVIECDPRSSKLNSSMVLIKLANRVLYSQNYISLLYDLFDSLKLIYKGITRIDLCYDCTKFFGGRSPQRFIQDFVFSNSTTQKQYARKGRDEFVCHGTKNNSSGSRINYISFGSGKSRYRSYIYDKTLELEQVKDKPWIRQTWEENGIIWSEKEHVYRSEISIKSSGTDMLNMGTGELFKLSPRFIENQVQMEKLFHFYAEKCLCFCKGTGQKRKKDYKQIQLFENRPEITCKPVSISTLNDTGRIEKICYNVLDRLSKTYTDLAEYRVNGLKSAMEFLSELAGIKTGILAKKRYESYLDAFKCYMFKDQYVLNYLQLVEITHEKQKQLIDYNFEYLSMLDNEEMNKIEYTPDIAYSLFESLTQYTE